MDQTLRTILLLGVSILLFAAVLWLPQPKDPFWFDVIRGASGGFGLAGCISFVMLLISQLKARK